MITNSPYMQLVGMWPSAENLDGKLSKVQADLLLLDYGFIDRHEEELFLGDPSGSRHGLRPRVLVTTEREEVDWTLKALRAGAAGTISKEEKPTDLLSKIHAAARGEVTVGQAAIRRLVASYSSIPTLQEEAQHLLSRLTKREAEVLRIVAWGKSNAEISRQLSISEATVKTHLNRTMSKLGISSRAAAVGFSYECGLIIPGRRLKDEVLTPALVTGF